MSWWPITAPYSYAFKTPVSRRHAWKIWFIGNWMKTIEKQTLRWTAYKQLKWSFKFKSTTIIVMEILPFQQALLLPGRLMRVQERRCFHCGNDFDSWAEMVFFNRDGGGCSMVFLCSCYLILTVGRLRWWWWVFLPQAPPSSHTAPPRKTCHFRHKMFANIFSLYLKVSCP